MHFDCTQCKPQSCKTDCGKQKGFAPILILVGILVIVGIAGGAYYFGKSAAPKPQNPVVSQISQPTSVTSSIPANSPVPTSVGEAANWKTYKSDNYGYSFRYPSSFWITSVTTSRQISSDASGATISDSPLAPENTIALFSITDRGKKQGESIASLIDGYMQDRKEFQVTTSKNITVNKHQAIYLDTLVANKPYYLIFIETDKSNVVILNISNNSDSNDPLKPTIDQIISTFKFLDQKKASCGSCPRLSPIYCEGTEIPRGKDECGCQLPPDCKR